MGRPRNIGDSPTGARAYREYEFELSDHSWVTLAITLGDPDAPSHPLVWMIAGAELILAIEGGDCPISNELRDLLDLFLEMFFREVSSIEPQLAGIEIRPVSIDDDNHTMH